MGQMGPMCLLSHLTPCQIRPIDLIGLLPVFLISYLKSCLCHPFPDSSFLQKGSFQSINLLVKQIARNIN